MRLLVTGATGFVGRHLCNHLERHGHRVEPVSRRPNVGRSWEADDLQAGVDASDAVLHLAGEGVLDKRWSEAHKANVVRSRVETTGLVAAACARAGRRLVSTSAVGFYGAHAMDTALDEEAAAGDDFLAGVCRAWEDALEPARAARASLAVVRVGVVLGRDGGALKKMLLPFKLGAGGPIAGGRQPFPWVHVGDLCRLYTWLATRPDATGVFNAVAPGACDQRTFARTLGRVLGRPAFLPTPGLALRVLIGPGAEMLTKGQHVLPRRAQEAGFTFEHGELEEALRDLLAG